MTYRNTSIVDYNNVNLFLCLQNGISKKKNKKLGASMESMRKKQQHLWGSSPLTLAGWGQGWGGHCQPTSPTCWGPPPLLFLLCGLYVRMRVGEGGEACGLFCEWEEGLTSGARRGKGWTTHHPCVLLDRLMCSIIPSNKVMSFEDLSVLSRSSWTIRQVRSNYPTKFDGA